MCLNVSHRYYKKVYYEFPEPLTCDKDILVFKSLNVATYSVQNMGACNYSTMSWSFYPTHSYETPAFGKLVKFENNRAVLETEKFGKEWDSSTGYAIINEGIHTCSTYGNAKSYGGQLVFFCVIPAGTEFYIGVVGDVVSKKIIIFEHEKEFLRYREERGIDNVIGIEEFENFELK